MSKLLASRVKPGSSLAGPNLKTLDETEENILDENEEDDMAEIMHMKIIDSPKPSTLSASSSPSALKLKLKSARLSAAKVGHKKPLQLIDLDLTTSSRSQDGETSKLNSAKSSTATTIVDINYDQLIPNKHGDLTQLTYANELEKYLITRVYSNVNKLSSILADMDEANLRYYLCTPDENECMPLYYAIKSDCLNSVRLLISRGSCLNKTTSVGDPAAHLACLLGVSLELIDYLLSFETHSNGLYKVDQEGWTVLHCASNQGHLEIVKYLIEKKFMNPNVKDAKFRYTGLQLATINNRINVVEYFLSFFSQATIRTNQKETKKLPFRSNPSRLNIRALTSTPNLLESPQRSPSDLAKFENNPAITTHKKIRRNNNESSIQYYKEERKFVRESPTRMFNNFTIDLNSQNNEGQMVLHLACRFGRYDVVEILLKKYGSHLIDVNMTDYKGRTCLDLAYDWIANLNSPKSEELKNKASLFYDCDNSYYVQRNMLIVDEKLETEIKLIHLLISYGAKFSNYEQFLYNLGPLQDYEKIDKVKSELNPFVDVNMKVERELDILVPIRTHLKLLGFILKLNIPTMILNFNSPNRGDKFTFDLINKLNLKNDGDRSGKSSISTIDATATSTMINDLSSDIVKLNALKMKKELAINLKFLIDFIQRSVIDSFEKQFYYEQIESLFELIANF